jgi:hypothetical protein
MKQSKLFIEVLSEESLFGPAGRGQETEWTGDMIVD